MSTSHHGGPHPEDEAALRRFVDEICHRSVPAFPQGKISADDLGETAFAIASDESKGIVIIRFTKPVDWLGLHKEETLKLAALLTEHANRL